MWAAEISRIQGERPLETAQDASHFAQKRDIRRPLQALGTLGRSGADSLVVGRIWRPLLGSCHGRAGMIDRNLSQVALRTGQAGSPDDAGRLEAFMIKDGSGKREHRRLSAPQGLKFVVDRRSALIDGCRQPADEILANDKIAWRPWTQANRMEARSGQRQTGIRYSIASPSQPSAKGNPRVK